MHKVLNSFKLTFFSCCLLTMIFSCGGDEEDVNVTEGESSNDGIAGRYVGGWTSDPPTSSKYEGISISAIFTEVREGEFAGEFFFTSSYKSCCGDNPNDGTLSMFVVGNEITSWRYVDQIPNCNGIFEGSGTVADDGRLLIEFTGSDCEGEHADASLFLRKQ